MRNLPKQNRRNSGQALLVILLIMAVGLTIGLSVTSRSITDIRISEQTEESARAFSAAEAGIEEALITYTGTGPTPAPIGNATYETATSGLGEGEGEFIFPQEVAPDSPQTLYLASYNLTTGELSQYYTAGTIDVCWGGNAALEATLYYQESGDYKVARYAVDPVTRTPPNNFDTPDADSCAGLDRKKTLTLPSGADITLYFLRLRVLYENSRVGVGPAGGVGGSLPSQGITIQSTGRAGDATRKVNVAKLHPAPPTFFDMLLYSQGGLSK